MLYKKNKVMIFGNGGSSAIASHFSVDLTKNTNAKTIDIKPSEAATKQSRWLTKNRFWNLAFLFLVVFNQNQETKKA